MYQVQVTMLLNVKTEEGVKNLKKLEHHAEHLLDLDSWPEIDCVHHVKVNDVTEAELIKITPKTYL